MRNEMPLLRTLFNVIIGRNSFNTDGKIVLLYTIDEN